MAFGGLWAAFGGLRAASGDIWGPLGEFWEAIVRLWLIFVFDALLGVVVAFGLSFGVDFCTDFLYHLVTWLFVRKCSPRGSRGFSGSVWRFRLSI